MTEKKKENSQEAEKEAMRLDFLYGEGVDIRGRSIRINEPIGEATYDRLESALSDFERENRKQVTIKINSLGGSVYDALAIVGRLKASPCKIITEGQGAVMSAATLILMCGDKRRMSKFCTPMFHQSSYHLSGDHENVKEEVAQMEQEERKWAAWLAEVSTKDAKFWYKIVKKKNFYPTPEQMLEYGAIDEII